MDETAKLAAKTVSGDKTRITLHIDNDAAEMLNQMFAKNSRGKGEYISELIRKGIPDGNGIAERTYKDVQAIKALLEAMAAP